ncbi:MAG: hypothetical protein ACRDPG_08460 [Nocardioidaceae bacterium]
MDIHTFHVLRDAVQRQATAGSPEDLSGLGDVYQEGLSDSGLLADIDVRITSDADGLIEASCLFPDSLDGHQVATELERVWSEKMSHPFWEVHVVEEADEGVRLEGATRFGSDGPYVTVQLIAKSAAIPTQRQGSFDS